MLCKQVVPFDSETRHGELCVNLCLHVISLKSAQAIQWVQDGLLESCSVNASNFENGHCHIRDVAWVLFVGVAVHLSVLFDAPPRNLLFAV